MCKGLGLKIVMLQPFANFEGWKPQPEERKDAFKACERVDPDHGGCGDGYAAGSQPIQYQCNPANIRFVLGRLHRYSYSHSSRRSSL